MSATCTSGSVPDFPHIAEFTEELAKESKWYTLGIFLGVPTHELDTIDRNHKSEGVMRCLIEVHKYLHSTQKPLSWEKIADCLSKMNNCHLACHIKNRFETVQVQEQHSSVASSEQHSQQQQHSTSEPNNRASRSQGHSTSSIKSQQSRNKAIDVPKEVKEDFLKLTERFSALVTKIESAFRSSTVSIQDLQRFIEEECELRPLIGQEATFDNVFSRLRQHYSLLGYTILEFLVRRFLGKKRRLLGELTTYTEAVNRFKNSATLADLMGLVEKQVTNGRHKIVKLKVREFWGKSTLKKFETMVTEILDVLYNHASQISAGRGCIRVSWVIPDMENATDLIPPQPLEFIRAIGVVSLHIGESVIYEIPGEGCEVLEAAVLQAIEFENERAVELLLAVSCDSAVKYSEDNAVTTGFKDSEHDTALRLNQKVEGSSNEIEKMASEMKDTQSKPLECVTFHKSVKGKGLYGETSSSTTPVSQLPHVPRGDGRRKKSENDQGRVGEDTEGQSYFEDTAQKKVGYVSPNAPEKSTEKSSASLPTPPGKPPWNEQMDAEDVKDSINSSSKSLMKWGTSSSVTCTPSSSPECSSAADSSTKLSFNVADEAFSFHFRQPPKRPDLGTKGQPIRLVTKQQSYLYHYDVDVLPGKCPRRTKQQIILQLQERHRQSLDNNILAFDGKKNLYSSKPLPSINGNSKTQLKVAVIPLGEQREREFEVKIQLVSCIPLDVLQSVFDLQSSLDIVTKKMPSMRFTTAGRSFLSTSRFPIELGQGRVAWFGRYQNVCPSMWEVVLNVDVSATAFYKEQSALDFLCEVLSPGGSGRGKYGGHGEEERANVVDVPDYLQDCECETFAKEINGLRVKTTHLSYSRKYKVKGVTREGASTLRFYCEEKQCTVEEYFKTHYKKDLRYPRLPCLHMEGKNKTIYIPIEFCVITEQNYDWELTTEQKSAMIRATGKPAFQRKKETLKKLREARFSHDQVLSNFGLKVYNEMATIGGRVLDPPKLQYEEKVVKPSRGQWDIRGERFYSGIRIDTWAMVIFPSIEVFDEAALRGFVAGLCQAGCNKGMHMSNISKANYIHPRRDRFEDVLLKLKKDVPGLELIVAILDKDTSYREIKRVGDNVVGVATQCVKLRNALRCNPATMANICLKINTKLGGTNSIIDPKERALLFSNESVIIFGADVTHPTPGDKRSPSIAAVTASMDEYFMEYRAVAKVLRHRQEVMDIDQLSSIVRDMLNKFRVRNGGAKPTRILFYRDGVSEGQFKEVIRSEVAAVQKACMMLQGDYRPGITFVIVQKRHHTRLFPVPGDKYGEAINVPPGTVVDTVITHPRDFDFFLCSHAGIQGTSKPCYYHVLWDDNNFSADSLQMLTYHLCHCYARCTRSVSYPAPTYYSHLVAFRARYHLQDWEDKRGGSDSMSTVSYSTDELQQLMPEMQSAIELNEQLKDTMYFM